MQGLGFSLTEVGELLNLRERKVEACESVKQLLVTGQRALKARLPCLA
jgi:DNA-binding transcriptional MerR regulator